MIYKNINLDKTNEEMFCPTKFFLVLWIITSLIMLVVGMEILWCLFNTPIDFEDATLIFLVLLAIIFIPTPIFIAQADILYINRLGGYFRIKNKIVPFNEISSIKYNYGFLKPYKYSIFSTVFYFVMKSGERIKFYAYFRGHETFVIKSLKEFDFIVKTCKYRDL